jgi:hypothetical protein
MKLKNLFAVVLFAFSAQSMSGPVSTFNLGTLGVPSTTLVGNAFTSAGEYNDQFNFNIGQSASASGLVFELDPWFNQLNIHVSKVSLYTGANLLSSDVSASTFNFGSLGAGSYTLSIFSTVKPAVWGEYSTPVGYAGLLSLGTTRTQVPEPGTLALFGLGLIGMAVTLRRKGMQN